MPAFKSTTFKSALAALVAALAVSAAAAAEGSRKTLELTAEAATAEMEMELGFDSEGGRRRLQFRGNDYPLSSSAVGVSVPGNGVVPDNLVDPMDIIERGGGGGGWGFVLIRFHQPCGKP